jgi:hypothetical protein
VISSLGLKRLTVLNILCLNKSDVPINCSYNYTDSVIKKIKGEVVPVSRHHGQKWRGRGGRGPSFL